MHISNLSDRLSWINVEGTWYKPKGVVVLEVDHIPTFGIINDIIAINVNDYYLVCEVADTECFDSHFHSYEISQNADPNYIVCRVKELADHYMLSMYHLESFSDLSFISMKYHLIDTV